MPSNQRDDSSKGAGNALRQYALASELPFLLVGATVAGGFLGYLLDGWLHTKPWFMIILGGLGFGAGVHELLRRLGQNDTDSSHRPGS